MATTAPKGLPTSDKTPAGDRRDVRRAWVSLALLPVSFVSASVLGDWLLSLRGYAAADALPRTAALWAGGPALLVLIAPAVGGLVFGLRAQRRGERAGRTPVIVAGIAIAGSIALNVLAFVITR